MNFTTDLTLEDYKALCWLLVRKTLYVLIVAVDAAFCYSIYPRLHNNVPLIILFAAAVFALLLYVERAFISWRAKRVYSRSKVSKELHLKLDDEGITQQSDSGETELLWEDVYRVKEDKRCFYVFLNSTSAFYFPKRSFSSKEHRDKFVELIIDHVPPVKVFFK